MHLVSAPWRRVLESIGVSAEDAWWTKAARFSLLVGALAAAAWMVYFAAVTITIPYPIEYREGASQMLTQFLLRGENPYALQNQPLAMNNNGIVYNLLVLPLAMAFGNSLAVHRSVTSFLILLCTFTVFRACRRSTQDAALALACAVLVMMALSARGHLGVFPSSTGVMFFLLGILLPVISGFDRRGLVLSAAACLMAFFTKPYFVLCFAIVVSYVFLFISRKRAVLYGLLFSGMLLAAAFLVRLVFPLYFVFTILSNASNTSPNGAHMLNQLRQLVTEFWPSLVLMGLLLITTARARDPRRADPGTPASRRVVAPWDRPLLAWQVEYYAYATGCSLLAFMSLLGWHEGSFMTYSYQLIIPPFFLWVSRAYQPHSRLAIASAAVLLLVNMLLFAAARFPPVFLEQRNAREWRRLYGYVDASQRILNTPMVVPELLRIGAVPVNTGKNEYFWHINPYPEWALIGPSYDSIRSIQRDYGNKVAQRAANSEFDRIITARKFDYFIPEDLELHYQRVDRIRLLLPQTGQSYEVTVWEPLSKVVP